MQFQFDPKTVDFGEATLILGMVLPPLLKGCRDQGETLAEVQASVADLLNGVWTQINDEKKGG